MMNKYISMLISLFLYIPIYAQFNSLKYEIPIENVSLRIVKVEPSIDSIAVPIQSNIDAIDFEIKIPVLFSMPLKNIYITSSFGNRLHPIDKVHKFHYGIDLRANNDTIYSIYNSKVIDAGYSKTLGHYIKISFLDYIVTYGHLKYYFYKKNDTVDANVPIGITGNTGKSTAPHLHFSVQKNGLYINPVTFIKNILMANNIATDNYTLVNNNQNINQNAELQIRSN